MSTRSESLQRPAQVFFRPPSERVKVSVSAAAHPGVTAMGIVAPTSAEPFQSLGLDHDRLSAAGFRAQPGETFVVTRADGPIFVATGVGTPDQLDGNLIRDAAAAFAHAAASHAHLGLSLDALEKTPVGVEAAAQAAVEGILLGRYEFAGFGREAREQPLESINLVTSGRQEAAARIGAERGRAHAEATILARNLANTPHNHLTATQLGEVATRLGRQNGFDVELFGKEALQKLDCGGLLGVNAGSVEPPCMIKMVYRPAQEPKASIALVGKGIMYDSGGISLKANDNVHARMKNDMSGAAAVLAAFGQLRELGCPVAATGYLMCTDNMPSGSAQALGDVITTHGGRTVEVTNTDAEGRLVMCDALALAVEEGHDAIVDIATLTGSVMRALGTDLAGVFSNDPALLEQVKRAARATGESVWQLPLHRAYREALDSDVAAMRNAGPTGGVQPDGIVAALYLAEFVGNVPWAHIDICGTAWHEKDRLWRRAGCSGFGARLLLELMTHFEAIKRPARH
jgi:leucyl aminopeptidase